MKSSLLGKVVILASVLAIIALIAVRFLVVDYSVIPQNGMFPGKPAGSRILGWKNPYRSPREVRRGDVVFFVRLEDKVPYKFVWRVVGLPGDEIGVQNDLVTINGSLLKNEFIREDAGMRIFLESDDVNSYEVAYPKNAANGAPAPVNVRVPENHFFVMGDNRYNSRDSRSFGPIAYDSIVAKAFY